MYHLLKEEIQNPFIAARTGDSIQQNATSATVQYTLWHLRMTANVISVVIFF